MAGVGEDEEREEGGELGDVSGSEVEWGGSGPVLKALVQMKSNLLVVRTVWLRASLEASRTAGNKSPWMVTEATLAIPDHNSSDASVMYSL